MLRYANGLFNTACSTVRLDYSKIQVRTRRIIINKYFSCCSAVAQKIDNHENNSVCNNLNENSCINEISIKTNNILDEDYEWCDIPADKIPNPRALDICNDDVSHISPYMKKTFNFAAYANKSPMIQELVKLGVELYKLECKPKVMHCLLSRNFEDMKPHIQFLYDCGVSADAIGNSITKNPLIFENDIDDLHTRIRYLRAHNFSRDDIAMIVTKNPVWLNYSTLKIDEKLAFFQRQFKLSGQQTRLLAVTEPRLITYKHENIVENTFAVKEEMGFDYRQMKMILLRRPKVWMRGRHLIVEVFDYVHNIMNIPHDLIAQMPKILTTRLEIIKNRHEFLKLCNRVQYDPSKPLYVSLDSISYGNDYEFCNVTAKTSIELYNMFLKTR